MNGNINLPSAKTMISTAASIAATAMVARSFTKDILPPELTQYFYSKFRLFFSKFNNELRLIVDDYDGLNKNALFCAAEIYLGTLISQDIKSFKASLSEKEKRIKVSAGESEELVDNFGGFQVRWTIVTRQTQGRYVQSPDGYSSNVSEVKYMVIKFHKKHKNKVIEDYLPFVLERSKAITQEKKTLKLHTLGDQRMISSYTRNNPWQSVNLDHPAKFETLAMDEAEKNMIIDDLDRFVQRKDFYRNVGKAWKRGYLLYGPPGTGKSSLIAAMANKLNFDVYDLELTDIRCNSDLRRLLITTGNRSILVVEDIDASIDLSERGNEAVLMPPRDHFSQRNQTPKVTLSGLLNFIDGLWSSCGDERIIVFTTNHIEKLDPALLRPGRMDVHIHMSYCTPCGFKMLLKNYLGTTEHPLAMEAEELISSTKVTPAEVAEQLLKNNDPEVTLKGLIKFLEHKKESEMETGNLEVTKREVPEEQGTDERKIIASAEHGIQELVKMAKASPEELRIKMNKDVIPESDLRFLVEFLQAEVGNLQATEDGTKEE